MSPRDRIALKPLTLYLKANANLSVVETFESGRNFDKRYNSCGIDGLIAKRRLGRPNVFEPEQKEKILEEFE